MLAMFFVAPESSIGPNASLWLGISLLGVGNIFFEFASVNYNAMLNHLADKKDMGRISGLGWGAGYVGGIVLLLILYVGLIGPNLLGVSTDNGLNIRIAMIIAALWFGLFALPVVLHPPKPSVLHHDDSKESLLDSYRMLWQTVKGLHREAPHTLFFLLASAVFRDGLAGVFTFGAILAKSAFGFSAGDVMIFAIAANVVAGLATIGFGALDDKIGPKKGHYLLARFDGRFRPGRLLLPRARLDRLLEPWPVALHLRRPDPVGIPFVPWPYHPRRS